MEKEQGELNLKRASKIASSAYGKTTPNFIAMPYIIALIMPAKNPANPALYVAVDPANDRWFFDIKYSKKHEREN